jgi:hypothetical protein
LEVSFGFNDGRLNAAGKGVAQLVASNPNICLATIFG